MNANFTFKNSFSLNTFFFSVLFNRLMTSEMTIVKVVGLFAKSPDVFLLCHEQEQTWFFIGSASAFVRRFFAHHTVFQLTSLQCFVFLCLCRKQLTFSKKKNDDSPINEGGKAYFRRWDFTDLYSALAFYTYCILNHIS